MTTFETMIISGCSIFIVLLMVLHIKPCHNCNISKASDTNLVTNKSDTVKQFKNDFTNALTYPDQKEVLEITNCLVLIVGLTHIPILSSNQVEIIKPYYDFINETVTFYGKEKVTKE